MTSTQKIQRRRREVRERLLAISRIEGDDYNDTIVAEERAAQDELIVLDTREATAKIAEEQEAEERAKEQKKGSAETLDAETGERIELRSKAMLTNYLVAAARGRMVDGAEAELSSAAGIRGIPLELWDVPVEQRQGEQRAITPAPGTVGINLDPIRPQVFANSIAARLGIDMPRVASGTFASATITGSQSAAAKPKSPDAAAPAVATAGALTVTTATPKRISARLELTLEDIAAVGQANFEAILRQNLALVLSDELDKQAINGDGSAPNLAGMFQRLSDPDPPAAGIADFDDFVAAFGDGVDGLWSNTVRDVAIVAGVETYQLSTKTFRDAAGQDLGDKAFADYAMSMYGGWWTNKRMPVKDAHIQQAILYRKARAMMGGGGAMRTAVLAHWGEVGIDDIYSGAASGTRAFTLHVLLGDVILVQPDAYAQVAFRVST